jgi:hypothetical protein
MMDVQTFLENSVYYPACGFDGTPIKFIGKMFSNYVYADYLSEYNDLENNISTYGLKGYKLRNSFFINAEELFGINWENFIEKNTDIISNLPFKWKNPFAKIYSFERCINFSDEHGKKNIELLYVKSEGISTYKYLYTQKNITPKCLVSIVPGLAFGGNFSNYPEMLIKLIKLTEKFPQYQFYDDQCATNFNELIKYYHEVNQYNCYRPGYTWSTHFILAKLK